MKPPRSRKTELAPNAMGVGESHAEAAEGAECAEFKMTELGPIPVDWEVKKIGDLACVCTGNCNTQDKVDTGKYPFYVRSPIVERINQYGFETEGVITVGDGVGTGKVFHYVNGKFALHQRCYLIYRFCPMLDGKYLYKIFSAHFYDRVMQMTAKSSVDSVRREMITDMLIPLPPLAEQRRIAGALSDVDELISALGKLIEKKRNIKTGAMQQLLTGKTRLPGFGVRRTEFKQTELGSIPVDWEVKRLGEIADFVTSTVSTLLIDEVWYIGTENMLANGGGIVRNEGKIPYQNVREYLIGDILISNIRPYLKKIWLADRNGGCSTDVIVIRVTDHNEYMPEFIKLLLSCDTFFDYVMANAVGTKMPRGDKKVIVDYEFPIPPLAEQKAIAAVLSDMDAEIAALEADRAKYERIKSGMMQELLTGKTRLKGE